jgi:hypothetical protein
MIEKVKNLIQLTKILIWFLFAVGFFVCIYDTYYWIYGAPVNRWISVFLYTNTRIIWALNTAVLIWMCITGNGGYVNKFFSWRAFIPLSRFTYSVYLTHLWILWIFWASKRDLVDVNNISILSIFTGVLVMFYSLSAIFSLLFESAFFKITEIFEISFYN